MTAVDPINAVVAFLRADSAVSARVGARVFSEELPESENESMPRQAVVVSSAGGGLMGKTNNFGDRRVDVACYGATLAQSRQLYNLAVRDALKNKLERKVIADSASTSVLIHWAKISADGVTAKDPGTGWPMTLSSWQVLAAETPINN